MSTATIQLEGEVLEGEVIDTSRRRERNEIRSARTSLDVLPPDVQTKVTALSTLDGQAQATAVTAMLAHSRTGLLTSIAAQNLPQVVEWKAKGAAIQEIAKQVRLGKDIQLDAAEFVRRAERGLGVAIREGQARGEITSRANHDNHKNQWSSAQEGQPFLCTPKPTDFATASELSDKRGGIYDLADDVTDLQFEEALSEARAEAEAANNGGFYAMGRSNVARKCKAKATEAVDDSDSAAEADPQPQPEVPAKKRLTKHDSTEMLANINGMLNGIVEALPFIDPADIDIVVNRVVIENMRQSMNRIRALLKAVENG